MNKFRKKTKKNVLQKKIKRRSSGGGIGYPLQYSWASLVAQTVKNPGDLGSIPGLEDPLEKGMATHSSVLAWRIPGTEEPGGLPSMGSHRVGHD